MLKHILRCALLLLLVVASSLSAYAGYEGDDIGYIDVVTLNGNEFNDFENKPLVYAPEDLTNGEIIVRGILESEQKSINVDDLVVQSTMDGGETWQDAKGNGRWVYRFTPELDRTYYFNLRVVNKSETQVDQQQQLFQLGDFFLKIAQDSIDESGVVTQGQGYISGLPEVFRQKFSSLINEHNELPVQLNNLTVNLARRSVKIGSVTVTPPSPLDFTLGPVAMQLSAVTFSRSSASIDGFVSLDGLGLPVVNQPFSDLHLGQLGFNGEIDLVETLGTLSVDILSGDYGFGLDLNELRVAVNTGNSPATMVQLTAFDGSLRFGSGFGSLTIPDLTLLEDQSIRWGKNLAAGVEAAGHRLILPGNLFSISELGGSINLADKELTLSGDIILPPELGSATVSIPANKPLTISAANGLSSGGELVFPTVDLPTVTLAHIDSQLTALTLAINHGAISGALDGELIFEQFGGLRIAVSAEIDDSGLNELTIDSGALNRTFNLDGFATLKLEKVTSGYYDHHFYVQVDGSLQATHPLFADYGKKVKLNGLRIFKNGIAFVSDMAGWKPIKGGSIEINTAELALKEYGLGVENGQLWFGLKGQASYQNNSFDLTARIFQDKHSEISDFSFDGLTLSLGDFSLRTAAELADGVMSGEGYINAGFLTEFVPAGMKDPLTGELLVSFTNLGVDLDAKTVTSGDVTVNFPQGMTVTLPAVQAVLRSISFGTSGAAVDGDIALTSIGGIDLPDALTDLSFGDISLKPAGLLGALSWPSVATSTVSKATKGAKRGVSAMNAAASGPLTIPVVTGEYGLTLKLTSVELDLDTTKSSVFDMVKLTDLDGSIELGSGYNVDQAVTDLRMLANGAITWGVEQANQASRLGSTARTFGEETAADAKAAAIAAANTGFSFTIPGTTFAVQNLTGRLYLADRQVELWGGIKLPAELGGGSFKLRQENSLLLSSSGISTQGPVDIDLGSLSGFKLGGFGANLSELFLEISSNSISGSVAGELKLSAFDNILIAVDGSFNGSGIREINVATDRLERTFTMSNFAAVTLSDVEGGYSDGDFYINIDGNLALENSQVGELPMTFDFDDLKVFSGGLSLGDVALPMHGVDDINVTLNGDLLLSLNQYGFGVTDNRFWIALAGGITYDGQSLTATAKVYHDGEFTMPQLSGDNLLIAVGDFTLRTSFDFSGGTITEAEGSLHLGSLMTSIPDELKNPLGELPVTIRNVDVDLTDLSAPKIQSGAIAFNTGFPLVTDFFTAQIDGIEVGAVDGAAYGKVLGGSIAFKQAGSLPMLSGISLTDIGLTSSGFSGTLAWSGDQDLPVFEDDNYGITANLTAVSLVLDSSQATFDAMVQLTALDGSVIFGSGYGTALAPALDYAAGAYSFATGLDTSINIPGTAIALKGFSGAIDFNAASVGFGGLISIPYEQTEVAFDVDSLTFSSSGVDGSIELANPLEIEGLGFPTVLTDAGLTFQGFALSNGHLGLDLTLEQFLDLEVSAKLALNSDGISAWSLGGETDESFSADAGFATLKVEDLGAGYDSNDGLFFTMNPEIKMKEDTVLSALPDDIKLSGLEVYSDHIDIDAASMGGSIDNATVGLAGVDLTLTHLALGYESGADGAAGQFNLVVGGGIALGDLLSADAVVTIYRDSYTLNDIEIDYSNPGFSLYGQLAIADNKFKTSLAVLIAGTINMTADLEVGSEVSADNRSFTYWRVALMANTTINLSPLPMNIYGIGGGIAYHQTVSVNESNEPVFTADIGTDIAITAMVNLGTLDMGYTYYGEFELTLEPTNFRMLLTGKSWFMKGKDDASGEAHLTGSLELGASPAMVQIIVNAKLEKEMAGMTLLGVNGEVDLLFSESDWHIYFGTAQQSLDVTLLEFLTGSGYIQLDSSGIAMGVRYEFDLEGSAWIFYGRVYGGAQIDLAAGIKPFYIDARGKIWIGLEAGVKARGRKFEIMSAYAELAGRFKAPPVYISLRGTARYSFLMGLVSGSWEVTFTMPEDPPPGAGDAGIESIPLVSYSSPEDGTTEVGRLDSISIRANMPIMTPFKYDDDKWYILCVKDPNHPNDIVHFENVRESLDEALQLRSSTSAIEIVGGRQGSMELNFTPFMQLGAQRNYSYTTTFELRHYDRDAGGIIGGVVNSEIVAAAFTTTEEEVGFRERVYDVYPRRSTTPVYSETAIYIVTKAVFDGYIWNWAMQGENLNFEVVNAVGEVIPGTIEGKQMVTDSQQGSRRYLLNFIPEQPLQPLRMVESSAGVKRQALETPDGYRNPFTTPIGGSSGDSVTGVTQVATGLGMVQQVQTSTASGVVAQAQTGRIGLAQPQAARTTLGSSAAERTNTRSGRGRSSAARSADQLVESEQETYTWYWDGEYRIQIVDGEGSKKYTSKFTLTIPQDYNSGNNPPEFASSNDVIAAGIRDPHFHANYSVDQEAYQADVGRGHTSIVIAGISNLWPSFINSTYGSASATCQFRQPNQIDAVNELLMGMAPSSWAHFDNLPSAMTAAVRRAAMEPCAPLSTLIDQVDQRFDEYKAAAFERNPSSECRSLEFRFKTDAPINWNEVEMSVHMVPEFTAGFSYQPASMKVVPSWIRHEFKRDEYIIRSQQGSMDHVIELKAKNKTDFDSNNFVQWIYGKQGYNSMLTAVGVASFFARTLQGQDSEMDQYAGEYNLQRGEHLFSTGLIDKITPSELMGR